MVGAHRRVVIDLGTGDGRFVVKSSAADPDALVIGIDANAAGLYDGFRRAQKAKLGSALFVVAPVEALPAALAGTASEVRIQFPWGSLLTAVLEAEPRILDDIAGLLVPGGRLVLLLSVIERDGIEGLARMDEHAARWVADRVAATCDHLIVDVCRPATMADVAASHSTWAKRLGIARSRPAWVLEFRTRTGGRRGAAGYAAVGAARVWCRSGQPPVA